MKTSAIINHLREDRKEYFGSVTPPLFQTSNFCFSSVKELKYALLNISRYIIAFLSITIILSSCSILNQSREMKNFGKCFFRLRDVEDVMLAGVDVQYVDQFSDLSFSETAKITTAALSGDLDLSFVVNVEVQNPNPEKASMNEFDWILFIDDIEITRGIVDKRIEISPNGGIEILPLKLSIDLLKVLSGESADAVINFGFNMAGGGGEPSRIKLKAKPSVYISGKKIKYPGYITLEEDFKYE